MANSILEPLNQITGAETSSSMWLGRIMTFLVIGIVSTAFLTYKFAAPYLVYFLPKHWNSIVAGVPPFYLFITVHFIILIVWKLRGLQHPADPHDHQDKPTYNSSVDDDRKPLDEDIHNLSSFGADVVETDPTCSVTEEDNSNGQGPWPPPPEDQVEMVEEEVEENVSMDAIWKAITGGGTKNQQQHPPIKKSETWEKSKLATTGSPASSETFPEKAKAGTAEVTRKKDMRKSETFRESTSSSTTTTTAGCGWRGRDRLLLVQDEDLFSKVEAFIKMNRDQMRVKRQESDHRYVNEIVNAAY